MDKMRDPAAEPLSPAEVGPGPRNNPFLLGLAWAVILGGVGLIILARQWGDRAALREGAEEAPFDPGKQVVQEMLGRYIVGAKDMLDVPAKDIENVIRMFPANDVAGELCLAVLEGEIQGNGAARERLDSIQPIHEEEKRAKDILARLYRDFASGLGSAPSVTPEERIWLQEKLGWFGELALFPRPPALNRDQLAAALGGAAALVIEEKAPDPARRGIVLDQATQTLQALGLGVGTICFGGFLGLIALILVVVYALKGRLQNGLGDQVPYWGIYAETFALWLVLFAGGILLVDLFSSLDLLEGSMVAMPLSLAALFWPMMRGVSWRQLCEDIGWTAGQEPVLEPFFGIASYVMALPLLVLGLFCFAFAMSLQGGMGLLAANDLPSHPIVEYIASNDPWNRFKIFFVACVLAPVVEETMFRGVFYRHVRDLTRGFPGHWSFVASVFLVSFLFAVVHPQGWLAVPVLMAIAIGLTIAREWRGTIFPSMLAHGINNGLALTMAIYAIGK